MSDTYKSRDGYKNIAKRLADIKSGSEIPAGDFNEVFSCSEQVGSKKNSEALSFSSIALRRVLNAFMDTLEDYERETSEILMKVKEREEAAKNMVQSTQQELRKHEAGLMSIEGLFSIRDGGWDDTEERLLKFIEDARRERSWVPDPVVKVLNYELTEILGYTVNIFPD